MSNKSDTPTIQAQLTELDELLAWFDQSDIDLDQALAKFEHGVTLAKDIQTRLQAFENRVTILKKRFDQNLV